MENDFIKVKSEPVDKDACYEVPFKRRKEAMDKMSPTAGIRIKEEVIVKKQTAPLPAAAVPSQKLKAPALPSPVLTANTAQAALTTAAESLIKAARAAVLQKAASSTLMTLEEKDLTKISLRAAIAEVVRASKAASPLIFTEKESAAANSVATSEAAPPPPAFIASTPTSQTAPPIPTPTPTPIVSTSQVAPPPPTFIVSSTAATGPAAPTFIPPPPPFKKRTKRGVRHRGQGGSGRGNGTNNIFRRGVANNRGGGRSVSGQIVTGGTSAVTNGYPSQFVNGVNKHNNVVGRGGGVYGRGNNHGCGRGGGVYGSGNNHGRGGSRGVRSEEVVVHHLHYNYYLPN